MIQTLLIVDCKFQRGRAFKRQRVAEKTWERNDGQTNQNGRQPSVNVFSRHNSTENDK